MISCTEQKACSLYSHFDLRRRIITVILRVRIIREVVPREHRLLLEKLDPRMKRERWMKVVVMEAEEKELGWKWELSGYILQMGGWRRKPSNQKLRPLFQSPASPVKARFCSIRGENFGEFSAYTFPQVMILFPHKGLSSAIYISKFDIDHRWKSINLNAVVPLVKYSDLFESLGQ